VGNARNRCIIAWFTPTWDSHMKVIPIVTVQNVFRVRGFGSMLQQERRRRSEFKPATPATCDVCLDQVVLMLSQLSKIFLV
jgi:hypothetical protein